MSRVTVGRIHLLISLGAGGALLAGLLAGCATPAPVSAPTPVVERVWPKPGAPRIRLLQVITAPEDVGHGRAPSGASSTS